jgi:isopenicillin-N N-acyltransferase-like protein
LKEEIRREAQPFVDALARRHGASVESALTRIVSRYEGLFKEHMPRLLEEIHGMAEGAQLSYPYAFFAGTRGDMRTDSCTAFVCGAKHTSDGRVLMGQTKDTSAPLERFRIMRVVYDSGRSMIVLGYPGWVGNLALTSDAVSFTSNSLYASPSPRDTSPGSFLKRLIMEKPSVQAVLDTIKGMAFENGCYTVADHSGRAVCLECVAGRVSRRDVSGQAFGHANTILTAGLRRYETTNGASASSPFRQWNIDRLLRTLSGAITADELKKVTRDHTEFPLSICRHPSRKDPTTTNAAFIADLSTLKVYIAIGNPCVAPFKQYPIAR